MSRFVFAICAILIFGFMNYYLYKRFFNKNLFFRSTRPIFALLMAVLSLFEALYFISLSLGFLSGIFYKICVICIGLSFCGFCISLVYDLLNTTVDTLKFSHSRRKFFKFCFDVSFLIIGFLYIFRGFSNAIKLPQIKEVTINLKNLSSDLNIAMISDVHIGEFLDDKFLAKIVEQINSINPDMVFIVGDLVDIRGDKIANSLDALLNLRSKFGVFFVIGNHEHYHGADEIIKKLKTLGVRVLENENLQLGGINLVGVNDWAGYRFGYKEPNLSAALDGCLKDLPTILLAHQPKFATNEVRDSGANIDLVLSGHTHGGQIFPFNFLVRLDQIYLHGLYDLDENTKIYVSSGAGFWGPPIRFLAPSEIVNLKLKGGYGL